MVYERITGRCIYGTTASVVPWIVSGYGKGPGPCSRSGTNWRKTEHCQQRPAKDWLTPAKDGTSLDRQEWCRSVAQCFHMDAG